ncbi:MAG TPA: GntR family transcriptional regulator [Bacillota bacterium]|nr:GntR family transcriptional regulator [Bacillota bacterium]
MEIVRDGRTALYYQIYDMLREKIEDGEYLPGDQIPTELELSSQLNVSRITVKKAIQKLVVEGLLYRVQGKGTFVSGPRVNRKLNSLLSFHDEMMQRGIMATTKLLELSAAEARSKVAVALRIPEGSRVIRVKRIRLGDGSVMAVQTSYIAYSRCPGLLDCEALLTGSLYKVLRENFALDPVRGVERYSVTVVDGQDAVLLDVPSGTAAFAVTRVAYVADGSVLEYAESLLRADKFTLDVELVR